jgi:hypothetical protein
MGEITNATAPEPAFAGKWIARIMLALILAEAIWGLIVSLTNNLILPALARVVGGDSQSPLYLGEGDFNVLAIFSSILELCLAGIVAALLNHWSRSAPARVRVKTAKMGTAAAKASIPSIAPVTAAPSPVSAPAAPAVVAPQSGSVPPPMTSAALHPKAPAAQPAAPSKPEKPKKPKEVYYNIVGEPINPTEDE